MTDALGHETAYAYDAAGSLAVKTDAEGRTGRYQYVDGKVTEWIRPDGTVIGYEYNEAGAVTKQTADGKVVLTEEYNEIGKLVRTFGDGGETAYG